MNPEILYTTIIMSIVFVAALAFSIAIIKTDWLYDKDAARWKTGINIPGLEAKEGDEVDHKGFKRFMGLNIIGLIAVTAFITIGGLLVAPDPMTAAQEAIWSKIFITILFAFIIIPIVFMFSDYKEKYIKRVNSKVPKHHKTILLLLISFLVIISALSWIFIS